MLWHVVVVRGFLHNDDGVWTVHPQLKDGIDGAGRGGSEGMFAAASGAVLDADLLKAQDRALRSAEVEHPKANGLFGIVHQVAALFGDMFSRSSWSSFIETADARLDLQSSRLDSVLDSSDQLDRSNESAAAALLSVTGASYVGSHEGTPLRDQPHVLVTSLPRDTESGRSVVPYLGGFAAALLGGYFTCWGLSELFATQGIPKSSTLLNGGFGQGLDKSWAEVLSHANLLLRLSLALLVVVVLVLDVALDDARHTFFLYLSRWALVVQAVYLVVGAMSTHYFSTTKLGPADLHAKVWSLRLNSCLMSTSSTSWN